MAARQQPKTNAGMVARHFDHPSGAKATLESPAGWSNSTFYRLTIWDADGSVAAGRPEVKSFATAAEARAGAIARERDALTSGWRPRMAAASTTREFVGSLYNMDGSRIPCEVDGVNVTAAMTAGERRVEFAIRMRTPGEHPCVCGQRILWRRTIVGGAGMQAAVVVSSLRQELDNNEWTVIGHVRQQEFGDAEAWSRVEQQSQRETIIDRYVSGVRDLTNFQGMWGELTAEIPDSAERQTICQEILRRRADREAQARRTEETEIERQREAARQAARDQAYRQQRERAIRQRQLPAVSEKEEVETLRRLSGGKELGKPKKRKIDLGE